MKAILIIFLFVFIFYSCDKKNSEQEITELINKNEALFNKDWIIHELVFNSDTDTMPYPYGMDKAWLNFTRDSVYVNTFGAKDGSLYQLFSNDSLKIEPILDWEECFGRFETNYCMNHEVRTGLYLAYKYKLINNQLTIYTHWTFNFILMAEATDSIEHNMK